MNIWVWEQRIDVVGPFLTFVLCVTLWETVPVPPALGTVVIRLCVWGSEPAPPRPGTAPVVTADSLLTESSRGRSRVCVGRSDCVCACVHTHAFQGLSGSFGEKAAHHPSSSSAVGLPFPEGWTRAGRVGAAAAFPAQLSPPVLPVPPIFPPPPRHPTHPPHVTFLGLFLQGGREGSNRKRNLQR